MFYNCCRLLFIVFYQYLLVLSSSFNYDEANVIRYEIDLKGVDEESQTENKLASESKLEITSKMGQNFHCSVPDYAPSLDQDKNILESRASENFTTKDIRELINKAFILRPCLTKTLGWWTYEFCYHDKVKQYHLEDETEISGNSILLGSYYEGGEEDFQVPADAKQALFYSNYTDGDLCDLKPKLRQTRVKFFCDDQLSEYEAKIDRIDEPEVCLYTITIKVGSLCSIPAFLPLGKPKTPLPISCWPILTEDQLQIYRDRKKSDDDKERQKMYETSKSVSNEDFMKKPTPLYKKDIDKMSKLIDDLITDDFGSSNLKIMSFDMNLFDEKQTKSPKGSQNSGMVSHRPKMPWDKDYLSEKDKIHSKEEMDIAEIREGVTSQFDEMIDEVRDELDTDEFGNEEDPYKVLSETLDGLLREVKKTQENLNRQKLKKSFFQSDESEEEKDDTELESKRTADFLKRKIDEQSQELEVKISEKLKKSGFDPKGKPVKVKVVASGVFDMDTQELHILDDKQSEAVADMIISVLGSDSAQKQEQKRISKMEEIYSFSLPEKLPDTELSED